MTAAATPYRLVATVAENPSGRTPRSPTPAAIASDTASRRCSSVSERMRRTSRADPHRWMSS